MAEGKVFFARLFFLTILISIAPSFSSRTPDNCESAANCLDCLDAGGSCKWCADISYDPLQPRCATAKKLRKNGCTNIQIKDGKVYKPPTDYGVKTQVQPKRISLELRPGESQSFTVSVTPSENFPVRLYYLMDMSNTMIDDLDNLRTLGTKIANGVKNLTNNFQLAFGTFVDKTVAPFTGHQWGAGSARTPCLGCEATFGYQHVFDFNEDARLFEDAVAMQRVSGNLDTPEGGFDALMQVVVCGDKIWPRDEHFRRIVVFVTDATPHIAGDGKIGGITTPNDGQCHLTHDMRYSKSTEMDYPSISHLKEKMKEHGVIPILAVTSEVEQLYTKVVDEWRDLGTGMGSLEPDSSNIVHLIRENYKKIATTIRLTDSSPGNVVVKYKVTGGCRDSHNDNECIGVGVNEKIDFRVSVTATNCPPYWRGGDKFNITVPGFGDITVDVDYICSCGCHGESLPRSQLCNGQGTLQCGICHCNPQRFGKFCECDDKAQADTSLCRMPNTTEKSICSGFGTCICGKCECNTEADEHRLITGTYCQCNNFGCDRFDGKLCGGVERGICKCGRCVCKEAFQGENCGQKNCTLGKKQCERHGVVCSGNGKCNCDQCECDYGYSGKLCETCVFCERKCKNNERCVMCHAPYSMGDPAFCATCRLRVVVVNNTDLEAYGQRKCSSYYNETCRVYFSYSSNPLGNETIHLEATPRCIRVLSSDAPIYLIILCIIGGIVLIVLLLLLVCKVIVTAYDRYEYGRFERDRMGSKWGKTENPIYRPAKRQFENPVYAGGVAGTCQVGPCHVVVKSGDNIIVQQRHTVS